MVGEIHMTQALIANVEQVGLSLLVDSTVVLSDVIS